MRKLPDFYEKVFSVKLHFFGKHGTEQLNLSLYRFENPKLENNIFGK